MAGIPAAESAISWIDGQVGILEYRGIPIQTLAEKSTFEETCYLLLFGELPRQAELDEFRRALAGYRAVPDSVLDFVAGLPKDGHPMAALQAGFAALGMCSPEVDFRDAASSREACLRLIAATPVIVAAFERGRTGQPRVAPDPELDTAGNFLWMITGEKPDPLASHVLDVALILHADHTMNASTFTARVVAATEADPYTMCAAAAGSLKGALHGGANERVLNQLRTIGDASHVESWAGERMAAKQKIMGFGHRVYKVKDPRSVILQGLARELFEHLGTTPIYDVALRLEEEIVKHLGDKGIHPNVDFFSGIVYDKLQIPTDLFTPVFAISRVAGWLAHWLEQMSDNRLFRPAQIYVGKREQEYVEMADR